MNRKQLIQKYLDFFKSKNHKEIPNSPLVPENDPTVLFTTAGMHPLVPYLLGQQHPQGKRLVNNQKCIRTGDIDEVGDAVHHTFFEMLGNWSLGDYWKKEAIEYSFEFLTKTLKIPVDRLAVSVFGGDKTSPKDTESAKIWRSLGIPKQRIAFLNKSENWWETPGPGPCGPDTEMFYWKSKDKPTPKEFDPNDSTLSEDGDWVEIWNDVLMQYNRDEKGNYKPAKQKNIDTGMGVERTVAILNRLEDNYLTDMWQPIIKKIEKLSGKPYKGNEETMRIIADHIKASAFIIADGITPSNTEQGYVLRKLIRRAVRHAKKLGIKENKVSEIAESVFTIYNDYSNLIKNKKKILKEISAEQEKFSKTIEQGLKKLKSLTDRSGIYKKGQKITTKSRDISGKEAFLLFQSYGFPLEMTIELAREQGIDIDTKAFQKELQKHQQLSKTATQGRFKSGLADSSEQTTKLHTATHLLLAALKKVLKNSNIHQKGSNITPERLRLDFNFERKLTDKEKQQIEDLVNQKIIQSIPIACETMSISKAKKQGAEGVFDDKYLDKVTVYSAGNFSKEICAGPHVTNTSELGQTREDGKIKPLTFKIIKEESSSAGVRRIKAKLE